MDIHCCYDEDIWRIKLLLLRQNIGWNRPPIAKPNTFVPHVKKIEKKILHTHLNFLQGLSPFVFVQIAAVASIRFQFALLFRIIFIIIVGRFIFRFDWRLVGNTFTFPFEMIRQKKTMSISHRTVVQ